MSVAPAATAASSHPRAVSLEVTESRILSRLRALYSEEVAQETLPRVMAIVKSRKRVPRDLELTEADVLLISYADHVQDPGVTPLKTLNSFVTKEFDGLVNIVHVLPF